MKYLNLSFFLITILILLFGLLGLNTDIAHNKEYDFNLSNSVNDEFKFAIENGIEIGVINPMTHDDSNMTITEDDFFIQWKSEIDNISNARINYHYFDPLNSLERWKYWDIFETISYIIIILIGLLGISNFIFHCNKVKKTKNFTLYKYINFISFFVAIGVFFFLIYCQNYKYNSEYDFNDVLVAQNILDDYNNKINYDSHGFVNSNKVNISIYKEWRDEFKQITEKNSTIINNQFNLVQSNILFYKYHYIISLISIFLFGLFSLINFFNELRHEKQNIKNSLIPIDNQINFYFVSNGEMIGPVSKVTIEQQINSNIIQKSTLVWKEGTPDWIEASKLGEFCDKF